MSKTIDKYLGKTVAEDAGYFHFSAKASNLVKPIIPKVQRIALECREAFGGSAENKNKNARDAQELQKILNWLELAASY